MEEATDKLCFFTFLHKVHKVYSFTIFTLFTSFIIFINFTRFITFTMLPSFTIFTHVWANHISGNLFSFKTFRRWTVSSSFTYIPNYSTQIVFNESCRTYSDDRQCNPCSVWRGNVWAEENLRFEENIWQAEENIWQHEENHNCLSDLAAFSPSLLSRNKMQLLWKYCP